MNAVKKYLIGYIILVSFARLWLFEKAPLFTFLVLGLAFLGVTGYEGKRFLHYLEKNQPEVYLKYKRTIDRKWLRDFSREQSKEAKPCDNESLANYCRRSLWVSRLAFPAFILSVVICFLL